jgi:cbb3-type cytochrome oxidase maturation protein
VNQAIIAQTVVTVSLFLIFLGLFIWGWKSGQFKNTEDIKYIVFRRPPEADKKSEDKGPYKEGDKK